jgi:hypothetical protein
MEILSTVMKRWSLQKGLLAARIETSDAQQGPGRKAVDSSLVIFVMVYSSEDQPD